MQKHNSNCSGKFTRGTTLIYTQSLKLLEILVVPREFKKVNFSPKGPITLKISDMKPWNLLFWKNEVCPSYLISCESHEWLKVPFCLFHSSQNKWIWMNIWLHFYTFEGLQRAITLLRIYAFRKVVLLWNREQLKFKIWNFESCRPLGDKPHFLYPLGLLRFQNFPSFLFVPKLSYSKPFCNILDYPSAANIQEVWSFLI